MSAIKTRTEMRKEILSEIEEAIKEAGGKTQLSTKLGKSPSYVAQILKRESFSGLQNLRKLIKKV